MAFFIVCPLISLAASIIYGYSYFSTEECDKDYIALNTTRNYEKTCEYYLVCFIISLLITCGLICTSIIILCEGNNTR